jgi:WD40 repeat protein
MRTFLLSLLLPALAVAQQPPTRERGRFSLQGAPATVVAIDPAMKSVVIGFEPGTICVFPADQRVVSVYSHTVHKKAVTGAAFLPDGASFVTVSLDGTLKRWDTAAALKYLKEQEDKNGAGKPEPPKPKEAVTAHSNNPVMCVAVSPDGKFVATGATDGTVKLWDPHTLKQSASLAGAHPGGVRALTFSPDSKSLASGGADKTAKLWDVTGEKPTLRHKLDGHDGPVNAVAFNPDGKLLAAGTGVPRKSGVVQVWDVATGKPAYKLEGHEDVVTCVVFHPKTEHLASGGADKKIRVWDLNEKKTLYIDEHAEPLKTLIISPDGTRFGSQSALALRWWAGFGK